MLTRIRHADVRTSFAIVMADGSPSLKTGEFVMNGARVLSALAVTPVSPRFPGRSTRLMRHWGRDRKPHSTERRGSARVTIHRSFALLDEMRRCRAASSKRLEFPLRPTSGRTPCLIPAAAMPLSIHGSLRDTSHGTACFRASPGGTHLVLPPVDRGAGERQTPVRRGGRKVVPEPLEFKAPTDLCPDVNHEWRGASRQRG